MYSNHCALNVSIAQVNAFLVLRTLSSWETEKLLNWNKNCSRDMSWNQLAQVGISDRVISGICDLCSVCTGIVR
jgi:hypothetical protein